MILKPFSWNIIIRILILFLTTLLLALTLRTPNHLFSIGFYTILLVVQLVLLIRYIDRINQQLQQFYRMVVNEDSTVSLAGQTPGKEPLLKDTLNAINSQLSQLRYDNRLSYSYLKHMVDHMNTAVIAYKGDGSVDLVNRAALEILELKELHHVNELKTFGKDFYTRITQLAGQMRETVELKKDHTRQTISLRCSMFRMGDQKVQLISFQNIQEELEFNELKSWEKLLRVITHEIMNSVSPIVSLTRTMSRMYHQDERPVEPASLNDKDIRDTLKGLDIINRRGNGLLDFIKKIRQMHLLPQPIREKIPAEDLFDGVMRLMKPHLQQNQVDCHTNIGIDRPTIYADRNMIEQVLINLLKNSMESLGEKKNRYIFLKAHRIKDDVLIEVTDNGVGIDAELLDDIFIPFFSTKKEGSGIGLSLSRQIMRLHGGNIKVHSVPHQQTTFSLVFTGQHHQANQAME